ncbi:MAG: ATP-binding cassette domain-containing protein [Geitlerinemataceae cyanobacterium]
MTKTPEAAPQLRLERSSLVASVGSRYLLKDISAEIFPGDRIVLAGASGAGKTLFLQLLNRRVDPSSGAIYLEGQDIRHIPPLKVRRSITLVPQEPKLLGMTVEETLAYPLKLRGIKPPEIDRRVQKWCDRWQIPAKWMSRTEAQLSLAQRQEVAICRALAIEPAILLLDDPLILLDLHSRDRLLAILIELSQTLRMTIVMSARNIDRIQEFSQRVLYLQEGELQPESPGDLIDWTSLTAEIESTELQSKREWDED